MAATDITIGQTWRINSKMAAIALTGHPDESHVIVLRPASIADLDRCLGARRHISTTEYVIVAQTVMAPDSSEDDNITFSSVCVSKQFLRKHAVVCCSDGRPI